MILFIDIFDTPIYNSCYMLGEKTVAVVISAYNEEKQITGVLETIPEFVDWVVVINDGSKDNTGNIVKDFINKENISVTPLNHVNKNNTEGKYNKANLVVEDLMRKEDQYYMPSEIYSKEKSRIILITHLTNGGKGEAVKTGYKWCRDHQIDCTATLDGDGQMDPSELEDLCRPIIYRDIDYSKGNRLRHRSALLVIPKIRFIGNSILSLLTKISSGYWHVTDTQTGFNAISLRALKAIKIHKIYSRYGYPNDVLVKLNTAFCTITEVDQKPVYNIGEKSKMNELKVVPKISWLLFKSFWKRLYQKYLFRDFSPLFLLYHLAFLLILFDVPFLKLALVSLNPMDRMETRDMIMFTFLTISAFQSLFFAMWMDMVDNERLHK